MMNKFFQSNAQNSERFGYFFFYTKFENFFGFTATLLNLFTVDNLIHNSVNKRLFWFHLPNIFITLILMVNFVSSIWLMLNKLLK